MACIISSLLTPPCFLFLLFWVFCFVCLFVFRCSRPCGQQVHKIVTVLEAQCDWGFYTNQLPTVTYFLMLRGEPQALENNKVQQQHSSCFLPKWTRNCQQLLRGLCGSKVCLLRSYSCAPERSLVDAHMLLRAVVSSPVEDALRQVCEPEMEVKIINLV